MLAVPIRGVTGLARFRAAQNKNYPRVLREIRAGQKQTHWMWYVFPQLVGLAKSETACYFGIADRAEAEAYLADPLLRIRLFECTVGIFGHDQLMLGYPDNHKLRSCMTLFREVAADPALPNAVLDKFFGGAADQNTLDLLAGKRVNISVRRPIVSRHYEKIVEQARANVAAAGRDRQREREPWSRERVMSFVRGYGLSTVATRQIVDAWLADQAKARREGWEDGHDEGTTDAWNQRQ